eukprot:5146415-Alexandrium_andersonii.AAC.1
MWTWLRTLNKHDRRSYDIAGSEVTGTPGPLPRSRWRVPRTEIADALQDRSLHVTPALSAPPANSRTQHPGHS